MNKLKVDEGACLAALDSGDGNVILYHTLAPLLRKTLQGVFQLPLLSAKDVEGILNRLGKDGSMVRESVLITCTEQNRTIFCLDVGELDQGAVEEVCEGNFVDLRKAFFILRGEEAPIVARGQALLRWHQGNGFCSASGQPTTRNQAGSQRVCHSNGHVYYPKMSPVIITLVTDGKRCLLARQASFPRGMYSALAGFCDMVWVVRGDPGGDPAQGGGGGGGPGGGVGPLQRLPALALPAELLHDGLPRHRQPWQHPGGRGP